MRAAVSRAATYVWVFTGFVTVGALVASLFYRA